jgi:hypothetical protein
VQAYRGFESLPLRHFRTELRTPGVAGIAPTTDDGVQVDYDVIETKIAI